MFVVAALTLACAGDNLNVALSVDGIMDVNASSTSYNQAVQPSDYSGTVSAWYFGHAT